MDAYASVGMPVIYRHWSYGKQFISTEKNYRRGHMGLAYEIVINSDPCIAYLMEENTMAMQALVIAHAAYGHNSFFKGNYLFKMWTDASSIIDYLVYARNYISECEERHGVGAGRRPARFLPRADEPRRRPLPPAAEAVAEPGTGAPRGARTPPAAAGQRPLAHPAAQERPRRRRRRRHQALSGRAAREPAVLHREERTIAGTLATRSGAHRAQDRAVLLPAAPDAGDERGLGHLLALHAAQHPVRRGPAGRRLHDRMAAVAHQRGLPAAGGASRLQRHQPLCAGLCDVHRPAAHLREADRGRQALVPRPGRLALAAPRSTTRCATSRTRASSGSSCRPS